MTSREELRLKAQLQQAQQFAVDRKKRRMAANIPANNAIAGEKTTDGKVKAEFADGSTVNAGLLFNASYTQGGVYPAVKRNDGQWFLLNQSHQPIRRVDDEEEVVEEVTLIKILFYNSTDRGLYIGGDREEPELIYTVPNGFTVTDARINATGIDIDEWIVSLFLEDTAGLTQTLYPANYYGSQTKIKVLSGNGSLDWELSTERALCSVPIGHGYFMSLDLFNPRLLNSPSLLPKNLVTATGFLFSGAVYSNIITGAKNIVWIDGVRPIPENVLYDDAIKIYPTFLDAEHKAFKDSIPPLGEGYSYVNSSIKSFIIYNGEVIREESGIVNTDSARVSNDVYISDLTHNATGNILIAANLSKAFSAQFIRDLSNGGIKQDVYTCYHTLITNGPETLFNYMTGTQATNLKTNTFYLWNGSSEVQITNTNIVNFLTTFYQEGQYSTLDNFEKRKMLSLLNGRIYFVDKSEVLSSDSASVVICDINNQQKSTIEQEFFEIPYIQSLNEEQALTAILSISYYPQE